MQTAMQKGFKQATGAWGKDLPDICQKTLDAANQKFEDYYKSKESTTKTEG
jgi:exonuclease VII small subunit